MIVFHIAFWFISGLFFWQIYIIRKEQKQQQKREFWLLKKIVDEQVDNDFEKEKYQKRLLDIEDNIRILAKDLRNATKKL